VAEGSLTRWLICPYLFIRFHDIIEGFGDLAVYSEKIHGQANREVALPEGAQRAEERLAIE
jgi:hypothetical protein